MFVALVKHRSMFRVWDKWFLAPDNIILIMLNAG